MMDSILRWIVQAQVLVSPAGRRKAAALRLSLGHKGWRGPDALILGVFTIFGLVPQLLAAVGPG
jgi:hypothetical protein